MTHSKYPCVSVWGSWAFFVFATFCRLLGLHGLSCKWKWTWKSGDTSTCATSCCHGTQAFVAETGWQQEGEVVLLQLCFLVSLAGHNSDQQHFHCCAICKSHQRAIQTEFSRSLHVHLLQMRHDNPKQSCGFLSVRLTADGKPAADPGFVETKFQKGFTPTSKHPRPGHFFCTVRASALTSRIT